MLSLNRRPDRWAWGRAAAAAAGFEALRWPALDDGWASSSVNNTANTHVALLCELACVVNKMHQPGRAVSRGKAE
jgi:hypothetical protein